MEKNTSSTPSNDRAADPGAMNTLVEMFFHQAEKLGDAPFLHGREDRKKGSRNRAWRSFSWEQAANQTRALAGNLAAMGIKPGDRVALVSENRPEWLIADHAIMAIGAISVPAYITNTTNDHLYLLADCGAKAAIVSTEALAVPLMAAIARNVDCKHLVVMEPFKIEQDFGAEIHEWDQLSIPKAPMVSHTGARSDAACIIYTSGTGGAPKGVVLSHGAILANCQGIQKMFRNLQWGQESFLSFLPLSHSYEHTAGQFFPVSLGAEIYYTLGTDTIVRDMEDANPTIMTAVPRLYEVFKNQISVGLKRGSRLKQLAFAQAVKIGRKRYETPNQLTLWERLIDCVLDRLVRAKVQARFGGRLRFMVSGGAPLNYEIGVFFLALGINVLQGYGQTESAPVISCNPPDDNRIDTVGPPLEGVELRIHEDGEILVRGELVMNGYWNKPDATHDAIGDGWLHTGDIGVVDGDGFVKITDRKKDIIVNSGGDNVSPQRIEGLLALEPEIAQAMVYGDRRPHLVALIVASDLLEGDEDIKSKIDAALVRVNAGLAPMERVRRCILADAPFTIENGQMTPTLKVRRHILKEIYETRLGALYHQ